MNELVVDRGPSPYLTNLELICNGRTVTTVQGDGETDRQTHTHTHTHTHIHIHTQLGRGEIAQFVD